MLEMYAAFTLIKIIGDVIYLFLLFVEADENWNKITRLVLAFALLIFNIIALWIGVRSGIATAALNLSSIVIWCSMCVMGIFRLKE